MKTPHQGEVMPVFIDSNNQFHRPDAEHATECPHCSAVAHMTPTALPRFDWLQTHRPAQIGVVLQCDACRAPVFLRYRVKACAPDRVELYPGAHEVERRPERFNLSYLPKTVASCFSDALGCYSAGLTRAFATMCRLTAQAVFEDLGASRKLKIFDQIAEIQEIGDIDEATFNAVRRVIFDSELEKGVLPPGIDRAEAAVLLETMKDMLYQTYVRGAKFRKALRMRQYFAGRHEPSENLDSLPLSANSR